MGDMLSQRGFSLIEVIIAVMVIAIALAAMLEGFGAVVQTQTQLTQQALMQQVAWQQWQALTAGAALEASQVVTHAQQDWRVKTSVETQGLLETKQVTIQVQAVNDNKGRLFQLSGLLVMP
jgi:prepilin-type N-terminal cleavage/methylation domain-containing protein